METYALVDLIKKTLGPYEMRQAVYYLFGQHHLSIRQPFQALKIPRTTYQYKHRHKDGSLVIIALAALADKHPSIDFWKSFHRIRKSGNL
jgi:hypothetical protein